MPIDIQMVRVKVANREPLTKEETHALFDSCWTVTFTNQMK